MLAIHVRNSHGTYVVNHAVKGAIGVYAYQLSVLVEAIRGLTNVTAAFGPVDDLRRDINNARRMAARLGLSNVAVRLVMIQDGNDPESGYGVLVLKKTRKLPAGLISDLADIEAAIADLEAESMKK